MGISLKPEYLKRYKDIAVLLWKYGRQNLVIESGLMETFSTETPEGSGAASPEELAHDLEAMGPLYIKLGQVLSSRPDILPAPYVKALARLQDQLQPFSFAEVERTVEEQLGTRITKAFTYFESEPIASASLGQVHRATMRDGREVAVKVQRPGIREEIAKDLEVLQDIAEFLDAHTEFGRRYRTLELLAEFRQTLARELDYRREASHLEEIGKNIAEFKRIVVPQPIPDYTTERVLTMDFVHGRKITAISPLAQLSMQGGDLAEQLFRAYLKQILVDGLFHADPHPGNVFLTDDYSVALIDMGMVGHLRPAMQEELLKLLMAISEDKSDEATSIGLKIGEKSDTFAGAGVNARAASELILQHQVSDLLADGFAGTLEQMQVGSLLIGFIHLFGENGVRMPAELTMLGKTLLNLDEIGRTLDPAFDPNAAIRRTAVRLTRERLTKAMTPASLLTTAIEAKEFAQELPRRVNKILDLIAKNELTVQVDAIEEKTIVDGFQKVANRIATGLILAALIVGAAMLMRVDTPFKIFGYPGLAIVCFLMAVIGGLWMLGEIALHDRKIRQ